MRLPILYVFFILLCPVATMAGAAQPAMRSDMHRFAKRFHTLTAREHRPLATVGDLIREISRRHTSVKRGGKVTQPFFTVRGQILKVNGTEIQAYQYRSVTSARKEADAVYGDGATVGTSSINWIAPPHFFRSGRLVVLYVGDDRIVVEMLEGVLGKQIAGRAQKGQIIHREPGLSLQAVNASFGTVLIPLIFLSV